MPSERRGQLRQAQIFQGERQGKIRRRGDRVSPREPFDHAGAAENREADRLGKPERIVPQRDRRADLRHRNRNAFDFVDREIACPEPFGLAQGRLRRRTHRRRPGRLLRRRGIAERERKIQRDRAGAPAAGFLLDQNLFQPQFSFESERGARAFGAERQSGFSSDSDLPDDRMSGLEGVANEKVVESGGAKIVGLDFQRERGVGEEPRDRSFDRSEERRVGKECRL